MSHGIVGIAGIPQRGAGGITYRGTVIYRKPSTGGGERNRGTSQFNLRMYHILHECPGFLYPVTLPMAISRVVLPRGTSSPLGSRWGMDGPRHPGTGAWPDGPARRVEGWPRAFGDSVPRKGGLPIRHKPPDRHRQPSQAFVPNAPSDRSDLLADPFPFLSRSLPPPLWSGCTIHRRVGRRGSTWDAGDEVTSTGGSENARGSTRTQFKSQKQSRAEKYHFL